MTDQTQALVLVDIQNDFCPGGALGIDGGDEIVAIANRLMHDFDHVILTQDWHPPDHRSFASSHPGQDPFTEISTAYGRQILWPDHCIQGTSGADFHPNLDTNCAELIIRKGFRRDIDSYSALFENDRITPTGLDGYFRSRGFDHMVLAGLATDFCVGFSALDARALRFKVTVVEDACRAFDRDGSLDDMKRAFIEKGIEFTPSHML